MLPQGEALLLICTTPRTMMLRAWWFFLLHNFWDILSPFRFRFTSSCLFSLDHVPWKKRLKIGNVSEPKCYLALFSTFLTIPQVHTSILLNTCSEILDAWTSVRKQSMRPQKQESRPWRAPSGFPGASTPHSTPHQPTPWCPQVSPWGTHRHGAIQGSTRSWGCRYSHMGNVHSTPKMGLVRI